MVMHRAHAMGGGEKSGAEISNVRRPSPLLGNVCEGTQFKYSSMNTSFKFSYLLHFPSFYSSESWYEYITHKRVRGLEIGMSATGSEYSQGLLCLQYVVFDSEKSHTMYGQTV
jgi:hypothetical protein